MRRMNGKRALLSLAMTGAALLLMIPSAPALELNNGAIRLSLNERTGSFALGYRIPGQAEPLSLLFPQDPRTTYFSLAINNQILTPGDSFEFTRTLERRGGGARFRWQSKRLEILQDFDFLASSSSSASNGIALRITITNISDQRLSVGMRYLLDTYLGENSGHHFSTDTDHEITGETEIHPTPPDYLLSPVGKRKNDGLMVMLSSPGLTRPDRVVLANWKRLSDASWNYTVNRSRNFSLPPYSINDSAAALYYEPARLAPGESRTIVLALGYATPEGFSPATDVRDARIENLVVELESQQKNANGRSAADELAAVRELIAEIDRLINGDVDPDPEKLYLLQQLLDTLKERQSRFSD